MEKIKIKVFYAAFFKLLFKYFFNLIHIRKVVSRKFGREPEALARISGKHASHYKLGIASVIPPRGIKIIYAVLDRISNHFGGFRLIDL